LENGRDARDGSSQAFVDTTRICSNARMIPGAIGASAPPASMAGTMPARISIAA
jgi:hypothetical protein